MIIDQVQNPSSSPSSNFFSGVQKSPIILCIICKERERRDGNFFATCSHNGNCIACAEKQMIKQINMNKMPKCFISPTCKAPMMDQDPRPHVIFQYFKPQLKQKYNRFKEFLRQTYNPAQTQPQNNSRVTLIPINCNRCHGVIKNTRCLTCLIFYCSKCGKQDHQINQKCRKYQIVRNLPTNSTNTNLLLQGGNRCINCGQIEHNGRNCRESNQESQCIIF